MDGIHDMGGMDGFGKVVAEPDEPPFHEPWEGRVLAMQRAMSYAGAWHIDMSRSAQERLPAQVYLTASYYQRWELAMERNLIERGFADAGEIAAGHAQHAGKPLKRKLSADNFREAMTRGSFYRQARAAARFKPGDRVRTRNIHPPSHTRLPRYARGRLGVVELVHGCHAFPDSVATDKGDDPQWLYTVVFEGRELWGADADPTIKVSIDAFEPYLEPA
ncbi:MAG TPA: nitrile hydratase subunit beta [Xanthobacteraceae bacterium]|jgi:nitrile hydratase